MTDNQQFDQGPLAEPGSGSPPEPEPMLAAVNNRGLAGLIELVYGVLFSPVQTFRRISQDPPVFFGFLIFLTVIILTSLVSSLTPPSLTKSAELTAILAQTRPVIGIISVIFALIAWFMEAGLFQLLAEFFGGKGRAVGVLTVLALAGVPKVLVIPFQVISYLSGGSPVGRFLVIAASLAAFVWWAVLLVIGLREIQKFSTARSVATLVIPMGILAITVLVFALALVGLIIPFAGGAFPPS